MDFGELFVFYLKNSEEKYYRVSIYERDEKYYYYRPKFKKFRFCIRIEYDGNRFRKLDDDGDSQNKVKSPFYKRIGKPSSSYDPYYSRYYDKFKELKPETPTQYLEVLGLENCDFISKEEYMNAIFSSIEDLPAPEDYKNKERRYPHNLRELVMLAAAGGKPTQRNSAMKRILKWGDQAKDAFRFLIEHGFQETMFGAIILATKYSIPGVADIIKKIAESTEEDRIWLEGYGFQFAPIYARLYLNYMTDGKYPYLWGDLIELYKNIPSDFKAAIEFFSKYPEKGENESTYSFGAKFQKNYSVDTNKWLLLPEYLKDKDLEQKYKLFSQLNITLVYGNNKLHWLLRTPFKVAELVRCYELLAFIIYVIDKENCTCSACSYLRRRALRVLKEWARLEVDTEGYIKTVSILFALLSDYQTPSYYSNRYRYQPLYNRRIIRDLIYGKSKRTSWNASLVSSSTPDILSDEHWQTREELFPEIWDIFPNYVWWLLNKTNMSAIYDFCLRILNQSEKGKEFISALDIKEIVSALDNDYHRVQDQFYKIILERIKKSEKLPEGILDSLVSSKGNKAWELALKLIKERKIEVSDDQLANLCLKPNDKTLDFSVDQLRSMDLGKRLEIVRKVFELIAIEEDNEKIVLSFIERLIDRIDISTSGDVLVPLFRSKNVLGQDLALLLIKKQDPKAGFLGKDAFISCFENPEANIDLCKKVAIFFDLDIKAKTFSLQNSIEIVSSLLQSPYDEMFMTFNTLSGVLVGQSIEGSILLLNGLIKNLIRQEISERLKETFLDLLRKTEIDIWIDINNDMIDRLSKLDDVEISMLAKLVDKFKSKAMPISGDINLVCQSEELVVRKYLVAALNNQYSLLEADLSMVTPLFESDFNDLFIWASQFVEKSTLDKDKKTEYLRKLIDSPVERPQEFSFNLLNALHSENIPYDIIIHLLEHPSDLIKGALASSIPDNFDRIITEYPDLFFRYAKTVMFLPNKIAKAKNLLYELLAGFANSNPKYKKNIQNILLKVGGGAIIKDRERALKAYVKIID